jgi:hypothetical protein
MVHSADLQSDYTKHSLIIDVEMLFHQHQEDYNPEHFVLYLLEDSIFVIWNKEALLDSWTVLSLLQDYLIQIGLLNGVFMNLVVRIMYNNPYHQHPFLCHLNPYLHHLQRCMTLVS